MEAAGSRGGAGALPAQESNTGGAARPYVADAGSRPDFTVML